MNIMKVLLESGCFRFSCQRMFFSAMNTANEKNGRALAANDIFTSDGSNDADARQFVSLAAFVADNVLPFKAKTVGFH